MDFFAIITINVLIEHVPRNIRKSYVFRAEVAPFPFLVPVFPFGWTTDWMVSDVICQLHLRRLSDDTFRQHLGCVAVSRLGREPLYCFSAKGQFRLRLGERVQMKEGIGAQLAKPNIHVIEWLFAIFFSSQIIRHIANELRIIIIVKPSFEAAFDISNHPSPFSRFLQWINFGELSTL